MGVVELRRATLAFVLAIGVSACLEPGQALGLDLDPGPAGHLPEGNLPIPPLPGPGAEPIVGEGCHSENASRYCLALKYVVYKDAVGRSVLSQSSALKNVEVMNGIYGRCNIQFQIDKFIPIEPEEFGLKLRTRTYTELDQIRNALGDDNSFLIVTTGPWDRTGPLGNTGANAWTSMPGGGPYGAIIESPVGTFSNIVAHEVGHYLNLLHVSNTADLMNPIIYSTSTKLYDTQCSTMRRAVAYYWQRMMR